jgi:DNA-binding NarL/FixJ family response regulator
VVLLDIRLPDGSGIEACRWIKRHHPGMQVLFLTSYADSDTLSAALEAGADGYLLKTVMGPDLADAVEKVGLGNAVIDPLLNRHILALASGKLADETNSGPPSLNDREKTLVELVTAGNANKEIAEILGVSEKTVRNLLSALYAKLGAKGQREALVQWSTRGEK